MRIIKKILLLSLLLSSSFIFSQEEDKTDKLTEFETSKDLDGTSYASGTVVSANKINYLHPDYPATPGDVYDIVYILPSVNTSNSISGFVDINYDIDLSFIGKVNVKGLIYTDVQELLKTKMQDAYPGSIVNVIIKSTGLFNVTLIGEVNRSAILDAMSLTTLEQIIAGRTTKYASIRDIEIRSEDGTTAVYDLFKFTRFADKKNNPYLKPNDVITIRPYKKQVSITGEIKRPGKYQLVETDTLYDLINVYGEGFTKVAEKSKIEVKSYLNGNDEYNNSANYLEYKEDIAQITKLNDLDSVVVLGKNYFSQKITLQGAIGSDAVTLSESGIAVGSGNSVSNKIEITINSGEMLSTVARNFKGNFNITSDLESAFIIRGSDKISVNIKEILENFNSALDLELKNDDIIIIPFRQLTVYVAGSVNSAGPKPFIENRTAEYYIGLAGGFNREENAFKGYSVRDVYGKKLPKDAIISPEDVIWVKRDHPMSYVTEYAGWVTTLATLGVLILEGQNYLK